jgi:allantoinase
MTLQVAMTTLPHHGRYDYQSIRTPVAKLWPGNKRLAFYIALNLEHFHFGGGLGAAIVPSVENSDILNYTWRDYGNRVGVWRILDLLEMLELPCTVLANSSIYQYCPEVMTAFRARGDEVVGHGRTNSERQGALDEASERELIAESTEVIAKAEGKAPRGWLGPWVSESAVTPDLLHEAGYQYCLDWCMDDRPVWLRTRRGRILSIPYPQEINDIPGLVVRQHTAREFADMIIDHFDEMLAQSESGPLVMGVALHPYLVGQPFRLRHLRRALAHVAANADRVWFAKAGEIADHFTSNDQTT